jgi:hypothetical protein
MDRRISGFAAVAATVVIVVGCGSSPQPSAAPSGAPTSQGASPSATVSPAIASPTTRASTSPSAAPAATPVGSASWLRWSVRAMPRGWTIADGGFSLTEEVYIEVLPDRSVMAADCDLRPEAGVRSSASDIVRALAGRKGLRSANRQPVTVGGWTGERLDFAIASGWKGTCPWWDDKTSGVVPLVGTFDEQHLWHYNAASSGEHYRYVFLDAPGGRNVLVAYLVTEPASFAEHLQDAMDIVNGLEFTVTG